MALDIKQMAKNPKLLIVVGIGVVGGIIVIGKLKPKESSAPVEVAPDIRTVVSSDQLQREDENSRALGALTREKAELEQKAQEERDRYQQQLDSQSSQFSSERDEFTKRLQEQAQSLGSSFTNQIQTLNEQIRQLQDKITQGANNTPFNQVQPHTGQEPITQPVRSNVPSQPTNGNQPINTTTPSQPSPFSQGGSNPSNNEKKEYPGLGKDYQMNCSGKPRVLLFNTFDELVADQKKKNLSSTSLARNCTAVAISGSTKWEVLGYDKLENELWRGWVNQTRVAWGLFPLTYDEMGRLQYLMRAAWPEIPNESAASFQSLSYARKIWEQYNRPYQCGDSSIRRY